MTTRRATMLSVVGVVLAGLIAALVNTQALAGGRGRAGSLLASPQPAPSATSSASTVVSTTASEPSTTVATAAPARVLHTFAAGSAGTITLDGSDGTLTVVAVLPAAGWLVSSVTSDGTAQVVVAFTSLSEHLVATAVLADGQVVLGVTTETTETTGAGSVPQPNGPTTPPTVGQPAPVTTAPRPEATDTQPSATTSSSSTTTTTTVDDDDDDADDHGDESGSGSGESGDDHTEPDD